MLCQASMHDGEAEDRGVEQLLADAVQRVGENAGESRDQAGADDAGRDAGAAISRLPRTPLVTAMTMPTMRPASITSRKTMISAPSMARPSPFTARRGSPRSCPRDSRRRTDSGRAPARAPCTVIVPPPATTFSTRSVLLSNSDGVASRLVTSIVIGLPAGAVGSAGGTWSLRVS